MKTKKNSLAYLDEFIRLKCAPSLLELFPNVKEISESMTALTTVRRHLGTKSFGDDSWVLFDICCGHSPRTAALFTHMTRWNCYAIDPVLKQKISFLKTKRLFLHSCKIQDLDKFTHDNIVITLVHPHVSLECVIERFNFKRLILIAMPCCQELI